MENYKELATRTECEYSDELLERAKKNVRVVHAVLGLAGELAELREAFISADRINILEELGDFYWYLAIIENTFDLTFEFDAENFLVEGFPDDLFADLEYHVCKLVDMAKRTIFYNKEQEDWDVVGQEVALSLGSLAHKFGSTVEDVKRANIEKLRARYGEKFSEERVLDRDLSNEVKVLEEHLSG